MALQLSGPISFSQIAAEFNDTPPHSISEFYGVAAGIPVLGSAISLSQFYGKSAALVLSDAFSLFNFTDSKGANRVQTFQGAPILAPWAGNAVSLTFPKTNPVFPVSGGDWPLYQYNSFDVVSNSTQFAANKFYFSTAQSGLGDYTIPMSLNKTVVGGGIYQNGNLLYGISSAQVENVIPFASGFPIPSIGFTFSTNIWTDLKNRALAGNVSGYEFRIEYLP